MTGSLQNPHRPVHFGDSTLALNCLPLLATQEVTVNIAFVPVECKYNTLHRLVQNVKRQSQPQLMASGGKTSDKFQIPRQKYTLT